MLESEDSNKSQVQSASSKEKAKREYKKPQLKVLSLGTTAADLGNPANSNSAQDSTKNS